MAIKRTPTPARETHAALVNERIKPIAIIPVAIAISNLDKVGLSFFDKSAIAGGNIIAKTAPYEVWSLKNGFIIQWPACLLKS